MSKTGSEKRHREESGKRGREQNEKKWERQSERRDSRMRKKGETVRVKDTVYIQNAPFQTKLALFDSFRI